MQKYLITIDGGTTNTRVALWNQNRELKLAVKSEIGVKDTAREGNNTKLIRAVKSMIGEIMQKSSITFDEVDAIYACGMLTSNVGIREVPHLTAPAGLEDFVLGVEKVMMPDICPVPVSFIPGMKNLSGKISMDNLEQMDIMRGEETETLALMDFYPGQEVLYVLPGSHTKFVSVNREQKMTGCLTSMAGELLALLTNDSILADAVKKQFVSEAYHQGMLLAGARHTWKIGLSRAAFLTRIVNQFLTENQCACASFLLGAVMAADILAVKGSSALAVKENTKVVIAGKEPLRGALRELFMEEGEFQDVEIFQEDSIPLLSGYGMCIIAEKRGEGCHKKYENHVV